MSFFSFLIFYCFWFYHIIFFIILLISIFALVMSVEVLRSICILSTRNYFHVLYFLIIKSLLLFNTIIGNCLNILHSSELQHVSSLFKLCRAMSKGALNCNLCKIDWNCLSFTPLILFLIIHFHILETFQNM